MPTHAIPCLGELERPLPTPGGHLERRLSGGAGVTRSGSVAPAPAGPASAPTCPRGGARPRSCSASCSDAAVDADPLDHRPAAGPPPVQRGLHRAAAASARSPGLDAGPECRRRRGAGRPSAWSGTGRPGDLGLGRSRSPAATSAGASHGRPACPAAAPARRRGSRPDWRGGAGRGRRLHDGALALDQAGTAGRRAGRQRRCWSRASRRGSQPPPVATAQARAARSAPGTPPRPGSAPPGRAGRPEPQGIAGARRASSHAPGRVQQGPARVRRGTAQGRAPSAGATQAGASQAARRQPPPARPSARLARAGRARPRPSGRRCRRPWPGSAERVADPLQRPAERHMGQIHRRPAARRQARGRYRVRAAHLRRRHAGGQRHQLQGQRRP